MRYLLLLTLLFLMVACSPNTDPIPPAPTATTVLLTSTALPDTPPAEDTTVDPTEVIPTEVATTEEPTVIAELDCEVPVYAALQTVWEANGADANCPTRDVEVGNGATQPFTNGTMIWASASDEEPAFIYVLVNDGTWQRFEDLWQEGDAETADLIPPAGQIEPKRGFGLVWREQLGGTNATIGWGLEEEAGREIAIQEFGEDRAIVANERVYWLFANGTWQ